MQRRILLSIIGTVLVVAMVLGIPLSIAGWIVVEDSAREDMNSRLKAVSGELVRQEEPVGVVREGALDLTRFRRAVPANGVLTVTYPVPGGGEHTSSLTGDDATDGVGARPLTETVGLGNAGSLTLSVASDEVRRRQWITVATVFGAVLVSILVGTGIGVATARRLAVPMQRLAGRAEKLAGGDFRSSWEHYGITELDSVSQALEDASKEIRMRLAREREITGQVSHQLRSRLTAIGLRLDELSMHADSSVVAEAEAAQQQVERLTAELDELVSVIRTTDALAKEPVGVRVPIEALVADFAPLFARVGRTLRLQISGSPAAWIAPSRLRESLTVLIDNALKHGGGDVTVDVSDLHDSSMMRISVSDQGPGIPDEIASMIFAPGFSGGASSGLGLTLARTLVESDGGRLEVTSRRPPTFTIVVPTGPGPETPRRASSEPR